MSVVSYRPELIKKKKKKASKLAHLQLMNKSFLLDRINCSQSKRSYKYTKLNTKNSFFFK